MVHSVDPASDDRQLLAGQCLLTFIDTYLVCRSVTWAAVVAACFVVEGGLVKLAIGKLRLAHFVAPRLISGSNESLLIHQATHHI